MARNALPSSTLSTVSSFRQQQNHPVTSAKAIPSTADRAREEICPECKNHFKVYTEGSRGWNNKPHQVCIGCFRARRRNRRSRPAAAGSQPTTQATLESDPISQLAAFQPSRTLHRHRRKSTTYDTNAGRSQVVLGHHIFTKGEWKRARLRPHPRVTIGVSMVSPPKGQSSSQAGKQQAEVSAVADTGAQSDLWSLKEFLACGFSRDDLSPVLLSLSAANHSAISIEGAFFAQLTAMSPDGKETS